MSTLENVSPHRHYPLSGTHNVRDVGGYPTTSGGRIRTRTLIRADALHRLDETGFAAIAELGVRTVIDLREASEREAAPVVFPGPVPESRWRPIFNDRIPVGGQVPLERIYRHMIEDFGDGLTAAVRELARPGALPAIVHCSAGKDRTGVVVALALSVAGVAPEVIAGDYALSSQYLGTGFVADIRRRMADIGLPQQTISDYKVVCPPELILNTLEAITDRHGSAAEFLLAHGATPAELAELRAALVEAPQLR
ncbi:tyrosine-protein phosphatase [Amycolatopsis sp. K13G38]|uniref:Tyrosine-protein phosphatase n=1 Tax=Amycolatopsis acididurans TaxID=2724524 RepID=A0ABX1J559_9PSEU|nr:tyrosine-protein phosphatase [Amycolatopsis acididurans]NKQ54506.1 tyrosine-protein phosphatase [Amycolatopsis acididurans]